MTYQAIRVAAERQRRRNRAAQRKSGHRRAMLRALDGVLEQLEQLNLRDRTVVLPTLAGQLLRLGVANRPAVGIPDLIERVFARQEQFMLAPPQRGSPVTIEELQAYFKRQSAQVA